MNNKNHPGIGALKQVLMERDGLTEQQAESRLQDCRRDLLRRLDAGEMPHDILQEHFGLEPDYIFDLF